MDCSRIRERLLGYVDDDLRMTERLCVDVHLAECSACREELAELNRVMALCRQVLVHPVPVDRTDELRDRIKAMDTRGTCCRRRMFGGHPLRWMAAAAVLALVAATVFSMVESPAGPGGRAHPAMDAGGIFKGPVVERAQSPGPGIGGESREPELQANPDAKVLPVTATPDDEEPQQPPEATPQAEGQI